MIKFLLLVVLWTPLGEQKSEVVFVSSCPSIDQMYAKYEPMKTQKKITEWYAACFTMGWNPSIKEKEELEV